MRDTNISPGDLYDCEKSIYCRDCKNYALLTNECLKYDIEETIKPDSPIEFCEGYKEREESGVSSEEIIRYLENYSRMDERVKARCIEAIKAQKHSKVEAKFGNHYCECGCPVEFFIIPYSDEIGKQPYCSECGARLDWEGVEIQIGE